MEDITKYLNKSIEECLAAMAVGKVRMVFLKKDGSFRIALATRCPALIPPNPHPSHRRRPPRPGVIPFYDLEKRDWRSMKREMFGGFIPTEPEQDVDEEVDEDYDVDHPSLERAYRGMDANDYQFEEALQSSGF